MVPPVPKYKSPPPRGKKRAIAITHNVEPDDEMFEREETPERANLLPIKRISKQSKHTASNDVTNYQFYKNTVSSSHKFGR